MEVKFERCDAKVFGNKFLFEGQLEPIGQMLEYLNNENRSAFPMYDVTLVPIEPSGPLSRIKRPQVVVNLSEMGLIFLLESEQRERVARLRNYDRAIAYTPHAILRGNIHRAGETRLQNLFDMSAGVFLVMTDVSIFPIKQPPVSIPQQIDLMIVNRLFINVIHHD